MVLSEEENDVVVINNFISSFLKRLINSCWISISFKVDIKTVLGDNPVNLSWDINSFDNSISLAKNKDL